MKTKCTCLAQDYISYGGCCCGAIEQNKLVKASEPQGAHDMIEYTVKLNKSDIGILTDIIIEQSKKCESVTTLEWAQELIEKIQAPIK